MYSLKQQLHRNLFITVTISMIVLLSVFYYGIQKLTHDYVASRLQHDIDSIIAALDLDQEGLWQLSQERLSTVYQRIRSGHYYLVAVNDQRLRSRSLFDTEVTLSDVEQGKKYCYVAALHNKEQCLICMQYVKKKGSKITIWIAEDISPLKQTQQRFMTFAIVSVILTIVFLLFMQYHILQRGFDRLEHVREAICRMHLGVDNISEMVLPKEVMPLVEEIRRLLKQLSLRVQRSRNALGNMAHELKRPLQRFQSQLETQNSKQRLESESILRDIQSVVERELKRARIVGVSTPGRQAVIDEDMSHLIRVIQSIYPEKKIEASYPEYLTLPHDRDDMLELLGNLLDNACKYATSKVAIRFEIVDKGWTLTIEDDGKGVTPEALKTISDRGVRLDESIQGHGIGLSICKDIVDTYSGEMTFDNSRMGGLTVLVFFPDI